MLLWRSCDSLVTKDWLKYWILVTKFLTLRDADNDANRIWVTHHQWFRSRVEAGLQLKSCDRKGLFYPSRTSGYCGFLAVFARLNIPEVDRYSHLSNRVMLDGWTSAQRFRPRHRLPRDSRMYVGAITTPIAHQVHTWPTISTAKMLAIPATAQTWVLERPIPVRMSVCKVANKLAGTRKAQMLTQWVRENSDRLLKSIM